MVNCDVCKDLDPKRFENGTSIDILRRELVESARKGCEMCTIIRKTREATGGMLALYTPSVTIEKGAPKAPLEIFCRSHQASGRAELFVLQG
jgi:hypothetical protein